MDSQPISRLSGLMPISFVCLDDSGNTLLFKDIQHDHSDPGYSADSYRCYVAKLLVQPLEQESTFLAAGPQIIDTAGPLRVPRIASGASAGFVAAGAQISDSKVSFDEIQLLPS